MPTPITTQTTSFTYDIADSIYASTSTQSRSATGTYTGPDRVWVFVDSVTNILQLAFAPLTTHEDGADVPTPSGTIKVEVTADDNPTIIAMLKEDCVTYNDVSTVDEILPDGTVFTVNSTATLSQTYHRENLTYDVSTNTWDLGEFIAAPLTWDNVIAFRNNMLTASDGKISPDMPDSVKQPWIAYRQALRDLPTTFGYGTENETEAWKVNYPQSPE